MDLWLPRAGVGMELGVTANGHGVAFFLCW